jgi:D-alanyl-D-alanine carboxypeptidase/D-alanyl-D-alanine-endopeptidase (penicillin-binding protein 4)
VSGADEAPAPVVRARRSGRPGRRWLTAAGVLAVASVGLVGAGLLTRTAPEPAPAREDGTVATTPVLAARRAPDWTARPVAARNLDAAIAPVLARLAPDTCVLVDDGATTLVASKDNVPLVPASNMKLLTASAALDLLGADTRLVTTAGATAPPGPDGTVAGDLVVVGGGDPVLSTATYAPSLTDPPAPLSSFEVLADRLVAAGVRRVTGSVVGDGSRYDAERTAGGWPDRFVTGRQVGNLSALMVNDAWTVDPLDPNAPGTPGPAADPPAHAAEVLTRLLQARGVVVDGPPRSGPAPPGLVTLAQVESPTVAELTAELLTFSDNTTSELLLKEMGRAASGQGTTAAGIEAVSSWAAAGGLPTEGVVLADGSGLSDRNRLTCRMLGAVLERAGPDGTVAAGLARPGRPGTLEDRLAEPDLVDRVRAKTGSLNAVRSLSGWLTTVPGAPLGFSIVSNTAGRPATAEDETLQGELLRAMLPYPQSPPADQLGPRPPAPA